MAVSVAPAMSMTFVDSMLTLPKAQRKGLRSLLEKFRSNPTSAGLNYEKVKGARDTNMRSLRIDQAYRVIVHRPDRGNTYILLWASKHDEAYEWARRHHCEVHPETGAIQVFWPAIQEATSDVPALDSRDTEQPVGPFSEYKARQLMRLGVPPAMTDEVRGWDQNALDVNKHRLPSEAYEALFWILYGDTYDHVVSALEAPPKVVDTGDTSAALNRDNSRSRFVLLNDQTELEEMMNAPLEKWRVFLHPEQRTLVESDRNGPVRVLGAAGTGKTVVALHRAKWLARQCPDGKKILFVTYNRNLSQDIQKNLAILCSAEELRRIEVRTLDAWVVGFFGQRQFGLRIIFDRDQELWTAALTKKSEDLELSDEFYRAEWTDVVQANGIQSEDEYRRVSRRGRGVALNRVRRTTVWRVFEDYRRRLAARGLVEAYDAYTKAVEVIEQKKHDLPYSSVIVDEAQDLGPPAFRLIRSIVRRGPNDLFIAGDSHQRIYRRRAVLSQCGIDIRGRAFKLKLNYRTTEQTRAWAAQLLAGREIDDLDGGSDSNDRIRSLTEGPEPLVRAFGSREDQSRAILDYLLEVRESGEQLRSTCIVARTTRERNSVRADLESEGLVTVVIDNDTDDRSLEGVRLATMHRVKGIEFERLIIASMNDKLVPLARSSSGNDDGRLLADIKTSERALVYVAASRAKRELLVFTYGNPSHFIRGSWSQPAPPG